MKYIWRAFKILNRKLSILLPKFQTSVSQHQANTEEKVTSPKLSVKEQNQIKMVKD